MKKAKWLAGTLALSAALMGTGYAYWTQQLTATTTVEVANFDVGICTSSPAPSATATDNDINQTDEITAKVVSNDSTQVTYAIANMYPHSEATLSFKIYNNSTITIKSNPTLTWTVTGDDAAGTKAAKLEAALQYAYNGTTYQTKAALETAIKADLAKLTPKTSTAAAQEKEIVLKVIMPASVTDKEICQYNASLKLEMNWQQFNQPADENADGTKIVKPSTEPLPAPTA